MGRKEARKIGGACAPGVFRRSFHARFFKTAAVSEQQQPRHVPQTRAKFIDARVHSEEIPTNGIKIEKLDLRYSSPKRSLTEGVATAAGGG